MAPTAWLAACPARPTYTAKAHGDLLAAGGGCAGGALVGGPGRDDASFAETQAHPGILYVLLRRPTPPDRRRHGLPPRPPLADRRGHRGLLRLRRPDRRRRRQRDARPARQGPLLRPRRRRHVDARDGVRDESSSAAPRATPKAAPSRIPSTHRRSTAPSRRSAPRSQGSTTAAEPPTVSRLGGWL